MAFCGVLAAGLAQTQMPTGPMSFFLTSAGSGNGGDLGGLNGADAICQNLADSVDQGDLTWRAYLSTQGGNGVNARDRIGPGPWFNANGTRIATDVDNLHSMLNRLSVFTALDQRGRRIPGSGYTPNRHDILTGTQADGTAYPADQLRWRWLVLLLCRAGVRQPTRDSFVGIRVLDPCHRKWLAAAA
jgi:hypothetical protein